MPAKQNSRQPSLFSILPADDQLGYEQIPPELALRPHYVWITISRLQKHQLTKFRVPVQWSEDEAIAIIQDIEQVNWQLNADGIPAEYFEILKICECFCNGYYKA